MPADLPDTAVDFACRLAVSVGAEGLRADLVLCRAAAAFAGWEGRSVATSADVERVAAFALGHRRRRRPFDPPVLSDGELERALSSARQSFADAYSQISPPAAEPAVDAEPAPSTVAPDTAVAETAAPFAGAFAGREDVGAEVPAVPEGAGAVTGGVDTGRPRSLEDDPPPAIEGSPDGPDLPDLPAAPGPSPWAGVTIGAPRDDDPVDDLPNDDIPNGEVPSDDIPDGEVPNGEVLEDDTAGDDLPDDIASGPSDELPDDGERSEDLTDPGADVPSGVAGHDDDSRGHVHLADDSAGPAAPGGQHDVTLPATAGAATVDDDPGAAGPADDGPGGSAPLGWTPAPADDRVGARHDLPVRPRTAGGIALAESVVRAGPHHDDVATDVAPDVAAAPVGARGEVPLRPRPRGRTVVIAVDASGSAGTHRRVEAATGAVLALLADAYLRRDRVSLVTFRGDTAEVVLPPTASVELARTRLAEVPTGGVTPLAEGINAGLSLARAAQADGWPPLLVLVTDGQATGHRSARERADAAAAEVAEAGMDVVVVDAEHGPQRLDLAEELASTMRGRCVRPDDLSAAAIESAVRDALR
jgi:magnesium chelatase subunit D